MRSRYNVNTHWIYQYLILPLLSLGVVHEWSQFDTEEFVLGWMSDVTLLPYEKQYLKQNFSCISQFFVHCNNYPSIFSNSYPRHMEQMKEFICFNNLDMQGGSVVCTLSSRLWAPNVSQVPIRCWVDSSPHNNYQYTKNDQVQLVIVLIRLSFKTKIAVLTCGEVVVHLSVISLWQEDE